MIETRRERMKLCGILFCLVALVPISANAQETRKPKAYMKEHFFDFKEVLEGGSLDDLVFIEEIKTRLSK